MKAFTMNTDTSNTEQQAAQAGDIAPSNFASMAKAFGKAAQEFAKSRTKVQATLDGVLASIAELEAEKDTVLYSPASRDEFVEALCAEVDRRVDSAVDSIQRLVDSDQERLRHNEKTLRYYEKNPHPYGREFWSHELQPSAHVGSMRPQDVSWALLRSIVDREEGARLRDHLFNSIVSCEYDPKVAVNVPRFGADMMAMCFGEALKVGLRRAFERIEWPYSDIMPSADRVARLAAIEADLERLRAQEAELREVLGDAPTDGA